MRPQLIYVVMAVVGILAGCQPAAPERSASAPQFQSELPLGAPSAAEVLQYLDMTSFRNSLGPRREPGLRVPSDWGFSELTIDNGHATLEEPGEWEFSLGIIRIARDGVIACFYDRARNGGTYNAQQALRIVRDKAGGYRVADQNIIEPSCPPLPGQG